jgi:hypothetical protein
MNAIVFLGPTLSVADALRVLDARYLPPAAQGDVLRAALDGPKVIAIVDGYFERVPAIWHKEILFAMARGIHVFGASSMGALRAAELAEFGMEGVGKVFADYDAGLLSADDEVAIAHAAADDGYRSSSEALVNIRATLVAACAAGIISPGTEAKLVTLAKALFFPERHYTTLLAAAREEGLPPTEITRLEAFLPTGRVDQKRVDALELLDVVRKRLAAGLEPKRVSYHFEHTDAWEHMLSDVAPGWLEK